MRGPKSKLRPSATATKLQLKIKSDTSPVVKGLRILSFFTGAGGLDLGFEQAGFETAYATDIDPNACDTLRLNVGRFLNPSVIIEQSDISKINPSDLPKNIDLIIGGPPCQSFSASGRRAGGASGRLDERGKLFESYCRIIGHVRPKAFVFENVRGILSTNSGKDWSAIVLEFGKLGYAISYRLLDALDYGAPQQRERMFLVGHRLGTTFLFPEPTHGPDSPDGRPHVTVGEAFQGIVEQEDLASLELVGGKYSHLLAQVPPGQNYLFFTAKRGHPKPIFAYRSRFSDFLYKANPKAPSKTIIASPGKYTGPLHWDNRYFSLQEYKRLQAFPDDFLFSGNRDDIIRQIGNSVSPKIAYNLALAIASQIFNVPNKVRLLDADRRLSFDSRKGAKAQVTRKMHRAIIDSKPSKAENYFRRHAYSGQIRSVGLTEKFSVWATVSARGISLRVDTDETAKKFASMTLAINQSSKRGVNAPVVKLMVSAYGKSPVTAQAMWDAVDDWVRRSSDFHSLFELYGHFTEPHPMFKIENFSATSAHPVALFAAHASNFENCSSYLPKPHLVKLFSKVLKTEKFSEIAEYLRKYRFDIRSRETNIAIPHGVYMVAYPFNLPARRQMNFRLRDVDQEESTVAL